MDRVFDRNVDWLRQDHGAYGTLRYAVPTGFEVYGVIDLPDEIAPNEDILLSTLSTEPADELIAGWIDRGPWRPPPGDKHVLYSGWPYLLRRVHTSELRGLPSEAEGSFPDLLFPPDHSWLVSLLWDDGWRSIGTSEALAQRLEQCLPSFARLLPNTDLAATGREPN